NRTRQPPLLGPNPDLSADVMLLFPDWHDLLQAVDGEPAGRERGVAMGRRGGDGDARFTYLDDANAVHDRDGAGAEALDRLLPDPSHLANRHLGVCLVLEPRHAPTHVVIARGAEKRCDCTGIRS